MLRSSSVLARGTGKVHSDGACTETSGPFLLAFSGRDAAALGWKAWGPDAVVSVLSPTRRHVSHLAQVPHLVLAFHDVETAGMRRAVPFSSRHLSVFLDFLADHDPRRLLVHCVAGISRSPALVLVAAVARGVAPQAAVDALCTPDPGVQPNRLILGVADSCLGTDLLPRASATFRYARGPRGAEGVRRGIVEVTP